MSILREPASFGAMPPEGKPGLRSRFRRWRSDWPVGLNAFLRTSAWFQPAEAKVFSSRCPSQFGRVPWTGPLLVLGDNQIQHEFGEPDSVSNMLDRWSEPSVRPPLTMLFGHLLLERELARNAARGRLPILHTGDAINTSCRVEFMRFRQVLEAAMGRHFEGANGAAMPFVMMPGNHDGFFMGNFQSHLSSVFSGQGGFSKLGRLIFNSQGDEWRRRCADTFGGLSTEQALFNKNDFLLGYLELLQATRQVTYVAPEPLQHQQALERDEVVGIRACGDRDGFFQGAAIRIVPLEPQQSFAVQLIRLPRPADAAAGEAVYMLLLDSANYDSRPRAAGMEGAIGDAQVSAALALWRDADAAEHAHLIFGFHHNIAALDDSSKIRLAGLARDLARVRGSVVFPVCVSAHRHRGGWYASRTPDGSLCGGGMTWTDLNASSMVDWPLARRRIEFWGEDRSSAMPRTAGADKGFYVLVSRQEPLFARRALERRARDPLVRSFADSVLYGRLSPLRRNPVCRMVSLLRDPLKDRYVAEYAILHEMALALAGILDGFAPRFRVLANAGLLRRLRGFGEPETYESGFRRDVSLREFESMRLAVHDAWKWIDAARHLAPGLDGLLADLIALGALEDYYSQWRAWRFLPGLVASRWYRTASNIDEPYALVKPLRSVPISR